MVKLKYQGPLCLLGDLLYESQQTNPMGPDILVVIFRLKTLPVNTPLWQGYLSNKVWFQLLQIFKTVPGFGETNQTLTRRLRIIDLKPASQLLSGHAFKGSLSPVNPSIKGNGHTL